MKLTKETIKESIEQYKAPNTEDNKNISLVEAEESKKEPKEEESKEKEEEKLPDAELEKPIVVPTDMEPEPVKEISAEEKKSINNSIYSILNTSLQDKFKEIDNIKSTIATIEFNPAFDSKDDIITILNSILDDCNIHIGMYQKALELIDPEAQAVMDQGKDKAEDILADSDLAEKEPEEKKEKEEDKEEENKKEE